MSEISVSCYKIISVNFFHEPHALIETYISFFFPQNLRLNLFPELQLIFIRHMF